VKESGLPGDGPNAELAHSLGPNAELAQSLGPNAELVQSLGPNAELAQSLMTSRPRGYPGHGRERGDFFCLEISLFLFKHRVV
jgi:hypothetical protein